MKSDFFFWIRTWEWDYKVNYLKIGGTAVVQWSRCFATNGKVAGSIPAGVNGFFIDIKSFRSYHGLGVEFSL